MSSSSATSSRASLHLASRAEPIEREIPRAPTVRSALSAGAEGFFYNSWRLVPANMIWGAVALLTVGATFVSPFVALLLFLLVLPFPTAGLYRLAALITRGEPVSFRDALAWRPLARRALAAGVVVGALTVVLGFNVAIGFSTFDLLGWGFATAAFWGLLIVWMVGLALWPLLFDPLRLDASVTELVRLAVLVALVSPGRYLSLMVVLAIVLIVSSILAAALLTISIAFVALVTADYALHAADRIEGRRTIVVTG